MSVKMLIAMIATVTPSFAVPTIVQAVQEKVTMGGLGQIEMFGPNLTKLAQSRQVNTLASSRP
jgi:hypothetical protein